MLRSYKSLACIAGLLFFISMNGFGQSAALDEAFAAAIKNDVQHSILNFTLESKQISVRRANLPDIFTFGAGANAALAPMALSGDDVTTTFSVTPGIDIGLPEPMSTAVSVDVPITISMADDTQDVTIEPELSVSQPLNELLGLKPSEKAKQLAQLATIEQARFNLASREIAVKKSVLASLRSISAAKLGLYERERAYSAAQLAFEKVKSLGELNPAGIKYKQVELAVTRAERAVEAAERELSNALSGYTRLTGDLEVLKEVELVEIEIPASSDADLNASVYLARLASERLAAELELLKAPFIPKFSVGASYAMDGGFDDPAHTVGGSFSAAFEHFSISAGLASVIAASSSDDANTLSGSVGMSFSLPDDRAERLLISEKRNSVEIGKLQLEQAISSYELQLDALQARKDALAVRALVLSEDRVLAEQLRNETTERKSFGLASDQEIDDALFGLAKLEYTENLIAIDTYFLALDIEALTIAE